MGSGGSGPYSGTGGGSQSYAETYHVVNKEMAKDKKDPDIYNPQTGYFRNPPQKSKMLHKVMLSILMEINLMALLPTCLTRTII